MTDCVVTRPRGDQDSTACVQAGAHGPDCPGDTCTGCAPTPAAKGRLVCTGHDDATRTALQEFADLYAELATPTTVRTSGTTRTEAEQDAVPQALPPVVQARSLLKSTLVTWCKILEDDFRVPLPDEAQIAADTRDTILRRQWDVDIAVRAQRAAGDPGERAHLAHVAERHRRAAAILRDERAAGIDVIRALAGHVNDHRAKLLAERPSEAAAKPDTTQAFEDIAAGRWPDLGGSSSGFEHAERARVFAEDVLDVHHRAHRLAYPNRAPVHIRCSCGGRVRLDVDPERIYTCGSCGEYGTLDRWRRLEAPDRSDEPMALSELPDWLLRWHGIEVTLKALRHWRDRDTITPVHCCIPYGALGPHKPGCTQLFDPAAVLLVARHRLEGKRSA